MDRFEQLPLAYKALTGIGAAAVFALVFYYMMITPTHDRMAAAKNRLQQAQNQAAKLKKYEKGGLVEAAKEKKEKLEKRLETNKELLPEKEKIPDLITAIKQRADEHGLKIRMFRKGERFKKDYVAIIPVKMKVEGSYPVVISFFDALAQRDMRMVTVNDIAIEAVDVKELMQNPEEYQGERMRVPEPEGRDDKGGRGAGEGKMSPAEEFVKKLDRYEQAVNRMRVKATFVVHAYSYTGDKLTKKEREELDKRQSRGF